MVYWPGTTITGSWQQAIDAKSESAGFKTLMIMQENNGMQSDYFCIMIMMKSSFGVPSGFSNINVC
jgi:hypothetical protein